MSGKIEGMTVSHMFETFIGGQKQSHFLSMKVSFSPPVEEHEFFLEQLKYAKQCTIANLQNAMLRGALSQESYADCVDTMKQNHAGMEEAMKKKIEKKQNVSTLPGDNVK